MTEPASPPVAAIDAVVNIWTPEALRHRPDWWGSFLTEKMRVDAGTAAGLALPDLLARMDRAGIEKAFLIATRAGPRGHPSSYRIPYELVAETVARAPGRLYGLAGIDPNEGMTGVRALETAVRDLGFIGAHFYPHWFEIAPEFIATTIARLASGTIRTTAKNDPAEPACQCTSPPRSRLSIIQPAA